MVRVGFADSRLRAYFAGLVETNIPGARFILPEAASNGPDVRGPARHGLKAMLFRSPIASKCGLFSTRKKNNRTDCEILISFNRLYETAQSRPYILYLENPTAFVDYRLESFSSAVAKARLRRLFRAKALRGILAQSKVCAEATRRLLSSVVPELTINVAYPIPAIASAARKRDFLAERAARKATIVRLLFVSYQFHLKGGKETVELYERLRRKGCEVELRVISWSADIGPAWMERIQRTAGITFAEATLDQSRLLEEYAAADVLVVPSFKDSMTAMYLEGLYACLPIVGLDTFANRELVTEGENGFLAHNDIAFFDDQGKPVKKYWGKAAHRICGTRTAWNVVDDLENGLARLVGDRALRLRFGDASRRKVAEGPLSPGQVAAEWASAIAKADRP